MRNGEPLVVKKRRHVARNRVFDVYFDHVVEAGGAEVPEYLVIQPRASADNLVTGVSVLPELDGNLGLLRVHRHAIGAAAWEVPRGFVETGESAASSAVRELEEETGLGVAVADLSPAGTMTPEAGVIAARVCLFIARKCHRIRDFTAGELGHCEFRWFSPQLAMAMAEESRIEDPSTLLLIYRYSLDARSPRELA